MQAIESEPRGKERLAKAFFDLTEEQSYDSIRVKDICERAGVTRQTFYRHFDNKDAIAKWYFEAGAKRSMFRVGRELSWHDSLMEVAQLVNETDMHHNFFHGDEYDSVKMYACRCREETLVQTIEDFSADKLTDRLRFQIRFFARAEAEAIADMMRNTDVSPANLAELVESCIPTELHRAIDSIYRMNKAQSAETLRS